MRQKNLLFGLLGVLFFSMYMIVPLVATTSPAGWANLPFADAANDVLKHSNPADPSSGTPTGYHLEIDIISAGISGQNLNIVFSGNPIMGGSYLRTVYIDNNSDGNYDFVIVDSLGTIKLCDSTFTHFWDSNSLIWTLSSSVNISYSILDKILYYNTVATAIPSLANAKIGIVAAYQGEGPTWYYTDFAPGTEDGIPSFAEIPLIFSLATIVGLFFILRRQKFAS